jgi:multiple sugar transport system permease protein
MRVGVRTSFWSKTVVVAWAIIVVFPLYWLVTAAFKQRPDIFPTPTYIPWVQFKPTLSAFYTILTDYRSQLVNAFVNSTIAATGSALLATLFGALAGYGLTRFRYRLGRMGNDDIAFFFISQRMLPPVAVVFPFLLMFKTLNLLDNPYALAVAYTLFNLPLAVWVMRDAFRNVPIDIEESALVDGCTRLGTFLRISLPLAAPGLTASLIICMIFAWNEFLFALVLTFRKAQTLPILIAGQASELGSYWWLMAVLAIVSVTPIVLLGLVAQRWIVTGLSSGGVKG